MGSFETFAEILDKFGTRERLAELLDIKPVTVRSWGNRDSIPPEHWPQLVTLARYMGYYDITYELLANLYAQRKGMMPLQHSFYNNFLGWSTGSSPAS